LNALTRLYADHNTPRERARQVFYHARRPGADSSVKMQINT
jgi:hypothetical protein